MELHLSRDYIIVCKPRSYDFNCPVGCTSLLRFTSGAIGAAILLCSLIVLACLNQDEGRHSFGHTGGMFKFYEIKMDKILL